MSNMLPFCTAILLFRGKVIASDGAATNFPLYRLQPNFALQGRRHKSVSSKRTSLPGTAKNYCCDCTYSRLIPRIILHIEYLAILYWRAFQSYGLFKLNHLNCVLAPRGTNEHYRDSFEIMAIDSTYRRLSFHIREKLLVARVLLSIILNKLPLPASLELEGFLTVDRQDINYNNIKSDNFCNLRESLDDATSRKKKLETEPMIDDATET